MLVIGNLRVAGDVSVTSLLRNCAVALAMLFAGASHAQTITFDDVMAAPDDIALNVAYARQEVKSGRLQQAAAALERILLVQPNYDSARLFYAVVLYRLRDLKGAVRELEKLEGRPLSPSQEADRVRYLGLASNQAKSLRFSARYTLGARLDSNPSRFSEAALAAGLAEEDADGALVASSRFRVERDIENGRGDLLFFQSNGYLNEYFDTATADLIASRAKAGAVLHGINSSYTPYAFLGVSYLQHERFRTQYGGGLDTAFTLNSQITLHLDGYAKYDDYRVTDFSAIGDLRDGWQVGGRVALAYRPTDKQSFRFTLHGRDKDAKFDGYSYDRWGFRFDSRTLFGEGRYLALTAAYSDTQYDAPDNVLSAAQARDDERLYLRSAVGAPLATIFQSADIELPEKIGSIVAQIGVSYTNQNSNIPLLDYDNLSGDILFTKRFNF